MAYEREVPVRYRMFWLAFTDLPRLLGEAPGLSVGPPVASPSDEAEGDAANGRLRLRVGSTTITYEGTARVARSSSETCVLELAVSGAQVRGAGTAHGTVRFELHRAGAAGHQRQHAGDATRVVIKPDIRFTGRAETLPAQTLRAAATRFADEWLDRLVEQFQRPAPDRGAAVNGERPALTSFHGDLAVHFQPPPEQPARRVATRHPSADVAIPAVENAVIAPQRAAEPASADRPPTIPSPASPADVPSGSASAPPDPSDSAPDLPGPASAPGSEAVAPATGAASDELAPVEAERPDLPRDTTAASAEDADPTRRTPGAEPAVAEPDLWPLGGPARPPWSAIFGGAVALFAFLGVLALRRLRRATR